MSSPIYDDGRRRVYRSNDGRYSISECGTWIPGLFADIDTAMVAFDLPDAVIHEMQQKVNAEEPDHRRRVITAAMLDAARTLRPEADASE